MNDSTLVERSELEGLSTVAFDTDVWVSLAIRVTASVMNQDWMVTGQFRATEDPADYSTRSPVFALGFDGATFIIETRSDPNATSTSNTLSVVRYGDPDFTRGVWHQVVVRVRFARTGNGLLQAWHNGDEAFAETAIPVGYNDTVGPYWKYGAYRASGSDHPVTVEYANLEVGTDSLLDRVDNPLPLPPG